MKRKASWHRATGCKLQDHERADVLTGALKLLREARDQVARAGAPRTLARVRLALTSLEGALRHADLRQYGYTSERSYMNNAHQSVGGEAE